MAIIDSTFSDEIRVGNAAELIVEADLLLQGIVPIRVIHKYEYDLLVPEYGEFTRVQIKAVSEPRMEGPMPGAYQFSLRKSRERVAYEISDIDVFVLVGLDKRLIAYRRVEDLIRPQGVVTTLNVKAEDFAQWSRWPAYVA